MLLLFSSTFTGSALAGEELFDSGAGARPREVEGCGEEDGGGGCSVVAAEADASSKSMEEKLMEAAG